MIPLPLPVNPCLHPAHPARLLRALAAGALTALLAAACRGAATTPIPPPTSAEVVAVENQPIDRGPVLLRSDMTLRKLASVGGGAVRLVLNPADGKLYYLDPSSGIHRVDTSAAPRTEIVAGLAGLGGHVTGLAIGDTGTLYVVANLPVSGGMTQASVRRGTPKPGGGYAWDSLATTAPYPLGNTNFDHRYNGIALSPDGQYVFVNAGSRTDHGEIEDNGGLFPNLRDAPLTARILRLPAGAANLSLPNDEAALAALGVVYATGTRNAYDMAFAPNGDLFAVDNGPDADYPDELNWIQAGRRYGFPWRFGNVDNPQQFAAYDPSTDRRLQPDFVAVQTGTYHNDPTFPKPPGAFTDPVANLGPASSEYRAADGSQHDAAAEGQPAHTFTPHRSPLGLVFVTDTSLPADLQPASGALSAFITSWGAAGGTLTDKGQDLLHLSLTRQGDHYQTTATQIARGFSNPIDAVLVANKLYVLDFGAAGAIWEITFH